MIVAGVILLLLGYLLPLLIPVPLVLVTLAIWLGWILLIIGAILWLLGSVRSQPVGRRSHFGSVGSWPVGRRRRYDAVEGEPVVLGSVRSQASSAPRPARRGYGSRLVAVARTPCRRIPGTSRSYAHRDTRCTAGARRASGRKR